MLAQVYHLSRIHNVAGTRHTHHRNRHGDDFLLLLLHCVDDSVGREDEVSHFLHIRQVVKGEDSVHSMLEGKSVFVL